MKVNQPGNNNLTQLGWTIYLHQVYRMLVALQLSLLHMRDLDK